MVAVPVGSGGIPQKRKTRIRSKGIPWGGFFEIVNGLIK